MKFNVGDRVKVITVKNFLEKEIFIGKTFTIKSVVPNVVVPNASLYGMIECTNGFVFREDELQLVEAKPFTKSDLKDGMVVEFCNGFRRMFLVDKFIGENGHMLLDHYNENLETSDNDFTISKVYLTHSNTLKNYFKDEYLELIWKRNRKMTLKEAEAEFDIQIITE